MLSRNRELFPLPVSPLHGLSATSASKSLSRAVRRRICRKNHNSTWLADGFRSINELSGYPFSSPPEGPCNASQAAAVDYMTGLYSKVPPPPEGLTGAGALSELCAASSRYSPVETAGAAPYNKDLVSWPPAGTIPCDIVSNLSEADSHLVVGWETSMLNSLDERQVHSAAADRPRPFLDPSLVAKPAVYGDFVATLHEAGMLQWRIGGPSYLGIFFVRKKSGKLRIILDTRDLNGFFKAPPSTQLPSASAFAGLETQRGHNVYFGAGDIADCF